MDRSHIERAAEAETAKYILSTIHGDNAADAAAAAAIAVVDDDENDVI